MRRSFYSRFLKEDAWLLYGDVGYGVIDVGHPRCLNVGIAEQTMVLMAAGMASEGRRVYTYAIAPHYLRAWEFVRNMLAGTDRDVTLVAVGVGDDYRALGKTHCIDYTEMRALCDAIGLPCYQMPPKGDFAHYLDDAMSKPGPKMLHLRKGGV
jgi:transketolase